MEFVVCWDCKTAFETPNGTFTKRSVHDCDDTSHKLYFYDTLPGEIELVEDEVSA